MDSLEKVAFRYTRRFGLEFEVNSFDKRDFKADPLGRNFNNYGLPQREEPKGIHEIADVVSQVVDEHVVISVWTNNHYNTGWIVKPDASCGIEICSPQFKGPQGVRKVCRLADALDADDRIEADERCSVHIHVDVADCSDDEVASIVAWWVKCEPVLLDAMPLSRKRNRYCQPLGISGFFEHDTELDSADIINQAGRMKYFTMNTFHLKRGNRRTVEFRIADREACTNSYFLKNWVKLIVHFVECAIARGKPIGYRPHVSWSSLLWLDPVQVFQFLKFDCELSAGMTQTRDWFLTRLQSNVECGLPGLFSPLGRSISAQQIDDLLSQCDPNLTLKSDHSDLVYSSIYKD